MTEDSDKMDPDSIKKLPEFDNHELVVYLNKPEVGLFGFISIHRINPQFPALGATRLWKYNSEEEVLQDSLRLAKLMSYKSLFAGLPYTGAKAVLMENPKALENREKLFKAYAYEVDKLNGKFITGTDVGVSNDDLDVMRGESKFFIGSGVDSGYYTAQGVYLGIKSGLRDRYGNDNIKEKSFAIQGVGKTGGALLDLLYDEAKDIFISDIDDKKTIKLKKKYPKVKVVDPKVSHTQKVDVFCPCALSNSINDKTIPELNCDIIVGAANNQLKSEDDGYLLKDRNILYAPDAIVNAGGLISVVDQYKHGDKHLDVRIMGKIHEIAGRLDGIFMTSDVENKPTNLVAIEIAEKKIRDGRDLKYSEIK